MLLTLLSRLQTHKARKTETRKSAVVEVGMTKEAIVEYPEGKLVIQIQETPISVLGLLCNKIMSKRFLKYKTMLDWQRVD